MRNLDKIPIFIDGKIKLITPIIDNYKIITDYEEYTLTKTFKNKYILHYNFYLNNELEKYSKYNFDNFPLELLNQVYEYKRFCLVDTYDYERKNIYEPLYDYYDKELVLKIYNELVLMAKESLSEKDEEDDYTFGECFTLSIKNKLKYYYKEYENHVQDIYILCSLNNINFVSIYGLFYKYLAKNKYNNRGD